MIILNFTILLLVIGLILTMIGHHLRNKIKRPYSQSENVTYTISLDISAIGYGAFAVTVLVLSHLVLFWLLSK